MGEKRTKVFTVRVDLTCDACGEMLVFTGITKTSNPPWFVHQCGGCQSVSDQRQVSGHMVYEDAHDAD